MKKSLIMVLALAVAGTTMAATVDWETNLGDGYDGMTWYVISGSGVDGLVNLLATDGDIDGFNSAISGLGANVQSGTFQDGWGGWQDGYISDAGDSAFLFVTDSLTAGSTFYYSAELPTASYKYEPPSASPGVLSFDTVSSGTIAQPVPEPTSVALLALGLAALGLKRKVA